MNGHSVARRASAAEDDRTEALPSREGRLHLLATVTFNPNQLRAHLLPLIALDEVASITLVADVPPPSLPKVNGVVPTALARRLLGRAGAKLALCMKLARRRRFDWVLGFNFVPHGFNAQLVARRVGTRSMYHMIGGPREWVGGGYSSDNSVLGRLPRSIPPLERFILGQIRQSTLVSTMGPRAREQLLGRGISPERVAVIPPSTDVMRFRPGSGTSSGFDLVAVAALIERKRMSDLVDAIALLRGRHPSLRVAVAGTGPLLEPLREHVRRLGLERAIAFLGHVAAIEELYMGAAAFVLCSRSEGMPISMLDAMAAGLPPVVTDVGEISTLVAHERNGLLFPVGDVRELARQIDVLVSDRANARRLGAEARADVVAGYSVDAVAAIYRRLITGADS